MDRATTADWHRRQQDEALRPRRGRGAHLFTGRSARLRKGQAPAGIAPVAGHVDQHGGPEHAAHAEVVEEVGLTVTSLHLLTTVWRPNRCRRPTTARIGHHWWIYQAQTAGPIRPSAREVRAPRWLHPHQLLQLALRTAAYAAGQVDEEQFTAQPGLEPVWARFLHELHLVALPNDTLNTIDTIL